MTEVATSEKRSKTDTAMNAVKHGILSHKIFDDEKSLYDQLRCQLEVEYGNGDILASVMMERVVVHILQLRRISHARNEFLRATQKPGKVSDKFDTDFTFLEVIEERYKPDFEWQTIDKLLSLYHRYEVSAENRLYRAIRELKILISTTKSVS